MSLLQQHFLNNLAERFFWQCSFGKLWVFAHGAEDERGDAAYLKERSELALLVYVNFVDVDLVAILCSQFVEHRTKTFAWATPCGIEINEAWLVAEINPFVWVLLVVHHLGHEFFIGQVDDFAFGVLLCTGSLAEQQHDGGKGRKEVFESHGFFSERYGRKSSVCVLPLRPLCL